jgi:hypothetical protein
MPDPDLHPALLSMSYRLVTVVVSLAACLVATPSAVAGDGLAGRADERPRCADRPPAECGGQCLVGRGSRDNLGRLDPRAAFERLDQDQVDLDQPGLDVLHHPLIVAAFPREPSTLGVIAIHLSDVPPETRRIGAPLDFRELLLGAALVSLVRTHAQVDEDPSQVQILPTVDKPDWDSQFFLTSPFL